MKPQTDTRPDSLNEPAPNCSIEFTQNFVRRCYGIECEVRQLACERDQIFAIHGKDGSKNVLRFTNTAEDPAVTNFQTEALRHLNVVNPGLPVPRLILDRNHDAEVRLSLDDGRSSIARMITYLPGVPLASVPHRNPDVRASMAESIAQLGRALRGFFHPAANHELLWISSTSQDYETTWTSFRKTIPAGWLNRRSMISSVMSNPLNWGCVPR
jgi:hydroxylysine kinase